MSTAETLINTTSAASQDLVGWVSPDARRNTWDIIFSCLTVFIICSWKCVHLNVPTEAESRGEWHKIKVRGKKGWQLPIFPKKPLLRKWGRKLMWMLIMCIAPEIGVAVAFTQWKKAREDAREHGCSQQFAFLVNMGGLVCRTVRPQPGEGPTTTGVDLLVIARDRRIDTSIAAKEIHIRDLSRCNIAYIPTDDEISDRSKSDNFTKLFAIAQSGWLIVSSIARVSQGYAITELELSTMAFILCAIIMYAFWWNKPFAIEKRYTIVHMLEPDQSVDERAETLPTDLSPRECRHLDDDTREPDLSFDDFVDLVMGQDIATKAAFEQGLPTVVLYIIGMAFSAVHFAAWNWKFPSDLVRTLWRAATAVAFGASFYPFMQLLWLWEFETSDDPGVLRSFCDDFFVFFGIAATFTVLAIYVAARLTILGLSLYCFTAMPASAYEKVEWTGWIPHFS
ncbi:hypothetical protein QBC47DRAFT_97312 [Echria macrotheca]|uniref:Uncharacterized protein n=1 Tax=Echria macrotheca TaxID=438768 RepID=A0AAJ0F8D9_9PEZI|nr:hypothetical protein QBC47DRAFT_97312 [Echria macrotheca]